MKKASYLNILYRHVITSIQDAVASKSAPHYRILMAQSDLELLSMSELKKIFDNLFPMRASDNEGLGPFLSIDELREFARKLLLDYNVTRAYLLDQKEYNFQLERINRLETFKSVFEKFGTAIANESSSLGGKNFFHKIFRD